MYSKRIIIAAFCIATVMSAALGGDFDEDKNKPAVESGSDTEGLTVLAKVGDAEITAGQVEKLLRQGGKKYPEEQLEQYRRQLLQGLIYSELMHVYLDRHKVELSQEEIAKVRDQLTTVAAAEGKTVDEILGSMGMTEEQLLDNIRSQKYLAGQISEEKVKKFIEDHPNYFNGTKVTASHILLTCDQTASTEEQKEVIARLEKIRADIKAGKITFEEAAAKYSDCPSGKAGGDLKEFEFARMVTPFSEAAYDLKVGEISGVVRTQFGFHIIKTTAVKPGSDKTDTKRSEAVAQNAIKARINNEILDQALTNCKIVIFKQADKTEKTDKTDKTEGQ